MKLRPSPEISRHRLSAVVIAQLAMAIAATAWAQDRKPISTLVIGGLPDARNAKILLIRAAGPHCRDSKIVTVDPEVYGYDQVAGLPQPHGMLQVAIAAASAKWKGVSKLPIYRTNIEVDEGCWCKNTAKGTVDDEDAGLAVMAPGRAVSYLSNQVSSRRPTAKEIKAGAKDRVPLFRLCASNEERIEMRPLREVPVAVWISDPKALAMARDEIANFDWILDQQLAGITLRPMFHQLKSPVSLQQQLPACYPRADDKDTCCDAVAKSSIFDSGAQNLYYGSGSGNFTCDQVPASFVHEAPILGDAAHELSHALGLFQDDQESDYDTGHTSHLDGVTDAKAKFRWDNVMWDKTHFLKSTLSPGQAFWMSQSCRSFVAAFSSCLVCADVKNQSSPCPPFSLGASMSTDAEAGTRVPSDAKLVIPHQLKPTENCETPVSIYRDGQSLEDQLKQRYRVLKEHVRNRPGLRLGSSATFGFLDRWEPSFALNLAGLKGKDPGKKGDVQVPPALRGSLRDLVTKVREGKPIPSVTCLSNNP